MKRGLTIAELVVVIVISIILAVAVYWAMRTGGTFFTEEKVLSDLLEQARTSETQLSYFFNRWGVGVPENPDSPSCDYVFSQELSATQFPRSKYCIIVNAGSSCDEVIFYGSTRGYLIVMDEADEDNYHAYACDMTTESDSYFYVWRDNQVIALTTGSRIGVSGGNCVVSGDARNAQISKVITDINDQDVALLTGDLIMRVPKIIRIYCGYTDGIRYLKASLQEGDKRPLYMPLVPVSSFHVRLYPEGCSPTDGTCKGLVAQVEYRYRLPDGTDRTFTKTVMFAR